MTDVKDSMPVLERFFVLMSYHTNRSIMPEMFWLFAHKGRNLENLPSVDHVLFHHTKRVAYKDGQYLGMLGMEMVKIRVRCMEASVVHVTVSIKAPLGR